MPTGVVGMEPHHDLEEETPTKLQTKIRLRILEIEKDYATRQADEYRKLLEQFSDGLGHAVAEPADGQRPVANSSSRSAPASVTHSVQLSFQRWQPRQPSPVARQDDGRERQQRTALTPPELELPPEVTVVRHINLENGEAFDGIVAALCADNSRRNRAAIFSAAGLCDYRLTPREAAFARRTPEMAWRAIADVFGGALHSERPIGTKVFGYMGNMICASKVTQPFAPAHAGEPGVLLFHLSSNTSALLETKEFHVLVDSSVRKKTGLKYCGVYTRVHTPNVEVQVDEWNALPSEFQMLCRLRRVSKVSDLHARCNLRKRLGPDSNLSPTKIDEWKRNYCEGSEVMMRRALRLSFDSGHEKFNFAVIKCVGFDPKLAKIIEQQTNRRRAAH
ncbi:hypothetical protein EDB92DRAFT_559407 [Lactarius akahatsu]|uniref:DUF6697 domain-containing protein n=1 Tax=Lactarius akahatsu TaxID=416441 RepID=A0AAD4QDZ0_9AGAM|nr:hypothetical protein EDB92DRAFT_559407 [Lactarius akahatsu]